MWWLIFSFISFVIQSKRKFKFVSMRANLFTLLLLSILTLGVLASENSTTADGDDNNTVYSKSAPWALFTYHYHKILLNIPTNSGPLWPNSLPTHRFFQSISTETFTLIFYFGQSDKTFHGYFEFWIYSWTHSKRIPDVRGSTANSLVYNISDQAVGTFDVASIKGDSSHDIIYSHTVRLL